MEWKKRITVLTLVESGTHVETIRSLVTKCALFGDVDDRGVNMQIYEPHAVLIWYDIQASRTWAVKILHALVATAWAENESY